MDEKMGQVMVFLTGKGIKKPDVTI